MMQSTSNKSRQCPRCRSQLAKTHSQKLVCRRCGYTSNKLQIVRQEQNFGQGFKFAKKVHMRKDKAQSDPVNQDRVKIYMQAFQYFLKQFSKSFFENHLSEGWPLFQRLQGLQTCRKLWFQYLTQISKQKIQIGGRIGKIIKKQANKIQLEKQEDFDRKQKSEQNASSGSESQQRSSQSSDSEEQRQHKQEHQKDEENNKLVDQHRISSRTRRMSSFEENQKAQKPKNTKFETKPKDSYLAQFKRIFNNVWRQYNQRVISRKSIKAELEGVAVHFARKVICKILEQNKFNSQKPSFSSLIYIAQKYVLLLNLQQRNFNQDDQEQSKTTHQNDKYQISKYSRVQDVKKLCKKRSFNYQRRRLYTQFLILLYDMLFIMQHFKFSNYKASLTNYLTSLSQPDSQSYPQFQFLILKFKKCKQESKSQLIQTLLEYVEQMGSKQAAKYEHYQKQVPVLSFKLVSALIYVSCVLHQVQTSLLEIINFCSQSALTLCEQSFRSFQQPKQKTLMCFCQQNTRVRKAMKTANLLFKYLESFIEISSLRTLEGSLQKWCQKYGRLFQIPDKNISEWKILSSTLLKGYYDHLQNSNSKLQNQRSKNMFKNKLFYTAPVNSDRYLILEQPQMVLSCLVIYCKLKFGLQKENYPYLKNILSLIEMLQMYNIQFKESEDKQTYKKLEKLINFYKNHQKDSVHQSLCLFQEFEIVRLTKNIQKRTCLLKAGNQMKDIGHLKVGQLSKLIKAHGMLTGERNLLLVHSNHHVQQNDKNSEQKQKRANQATILLNQFSFCSALRKQVWVLYEEFSEFKNKYCQSQSSSSPSSLSLSLKLFQWLDKPQQNYELTYNPSINSLHQLELNEQMLLIQKLSVHLLGEHSNCKQLIEWMGYFQSVLTLFEE